MRTTGAVIGLGILAAAVARAETESAAATSAVPAMDVTAAVSRGVEFFCAEAARDDGGWFFGPLEGKRVIGWKTNQVAFKEITITVLDYEYETHEPPIRGIKVQLSACDPVEGAGNGSKAIKRSLGCNSQAVPTRNEMPGNNINHVPMRSSVPSADISFSTRTDHEEYPSLVATTTGSDFRFKATTTGRPPLSTTHRLAVDKNLCTGYARGNC